MPCAVLIYSGHSIRVAQTTCKYMCLWINLNVLDLYEGNDPNGILDWRSLKKSVFIRFAVLWANFWRRILANKSVDKWFCADYYRHWTNMMWKQVWWNESLGVLFTHTYCDMKINTFMHQSALLCLDELRFCTLHCTLEYCMPPCNALDLLPVLWINGIRLFCQMLNI